MRMMCWTRDRVYRMQSHRTEGPLHSDRHARHRMNYPYSNRRRNIANLSTAMILFRQPPDARRARSPRPPLPRKPRRWGRFPISPFLNRPCPQFNHSRAVSPASVHLLRLGEGHRHTIRRCPMYHQLRKRQRRARTRYAHITVHSHRAWRYLRMRIITWRTHMYDRTMRKP